MQYPRTWEGINDDEHAGSARLRVHGGWLVIAWSNDGVSETLCFVPDEKHEWILVEQAV
jgi:hypothetical protein